MADPPLCAWCERAEATTTRPDKGRQYPICDDCAKHWLVPQQLF